MVVAVRELKTHAALQTRVGIATGLVVVGDLFGSGASGEQSIVGETPNLAARLLGIGKTTLYRKLKEYDLADLAELAGNEIQTR